MASGDSPFKTGAARGIKMKVNSVARLTRGPETRDRVLGLAHGGVHDDEIAATLTGEGHRSPNCEDRVLLITVSRIRRGAGIQVIERRTKIAGRQWQMLQHQPQ